jgi:hypothetical protein
VALSSTESEYIALSTGARDAVWLRRFLNELEFPQGESTTIYVDNQSSIRLAKNPEMHNRSKHIDVRYHHVRDLVSSGEIELQYIPTTEQLADVLTKPLLKTLHQKMKNGLNMITAEDKPSNVFTPTQEEREKEPAKPTHGIKEFPAKGPKLKIPLGLALMFLFCMCGTASGLLNEHQVPVLWRKSPIPVTTGQSQVYLLINLVNPCEILTSDIAHHDLAANAREKCNKIYTEMFVNEVENLCPKKTFTGNIYRIERAIPLLIGAVWGVITLSAGLGVAGTVISALNMASIGRIQTKLDLEKEQLEMLSSSLEWSQKQMDELRSNFNDAMGQMQVQQADQDELKNKFISTNFAISYLTTRLMMGQEILRESVRQWKQGKVYAPLMDYFNFTMPCGDDCPLYLSQAQKCELSEDGTKLYIDFSAPIINQTLQLIEADPFDLMLRRKNSTCTVRYIGNRNLLVSTTENCIYTVNVNRHFTHDLLVSPAHGCRPNTNSTEETKHFVVDHCQSQHELDYYDFVQIKPHHSQFYVYCPESI